MNSLLYYILIKEAINFFFSEQEIPWRHWSVLWKIFFFNGNFFKEFLVW